MFYDCTFCCCGVEVHNGTRKKQATTYQNTNFGVMKQTECKPNQRGFFCGKYFADARKRAEFYQKPEGDFQAIRTGVWDFLC
jgi:hypothetical protein